MGLGFRVEGKARAKARAKVKAKARAKAKAKARAKSQGMADDFFEQQLQIFFDKNFPESELVRKNNPSYI